VSVVVPQPHPTSSTEWCGSSWTRANSGVGEGRELAVVSVGVVDKVRRLGAVPGRGLLLVRVHRGSLVWLRAGQTMIPTRG
jgi:hypothetical protein